MARKATNLGMRTAALIYAFTIGAVLGAIILFSAAILAVADIILQAAGRGGMMQYDSVWKPVYQTFKWWIELLKAALFGGARTFTFIPPNPLG